MAKRTGRPPQLHDKAKAVLARDEIAERYPALRALLRRLDLGNGQPLSTAELALEQAQAELDEAPFEDQVLRSSPTVDEALLNVANRISRLSASARILSGLKSTIDGQLQAALTELELARGELLSLAVQREDVHEYAPSLIRKLKAVGLTKENSRSLTTNQLGQIGSIITGQPAQKLTDALNGRRDRAAPVGQSVTKEKFHSTGPAVLNGERGEGARSETSADLALPKTNKANAAPSATQASPTPQRAIWRNFPKVLEHYSLSRLAVVSAFERQFVEMELPPFVDLQSYGEPKLYKQFVTHPHVGVKELSAWEMCKRWWMRVRGCELDDAHRAPWMFLICTDYGFAHKLPGLDQVTLPSPWVPGGVIQATETTPYSRQSKATHYWSPAEDGSATH